MNSTDDVVAYAKAHGLDKLISFERVTPQLSVTERVDSRVTEPYAADWIDLVRLHRLVLDRKVATILEFGVGKSTVILAHALAINAERHGAYFAQKLRRRELFELHSVDAMPEFINSTRELVPEALKGHVNLHHSPVKMSTFNDRICTFYDSIPNICPDLIYLDAPSQASALESVRGITTAHQDRVPMSADILPIEHFLLPGTLIHIDGRAANARFLRANLQRNWRYEYDEGGDAHSFELCEPPLGKYNRAQIIYCLGQDWRGLKVDGSLPPARPAR
jgi:hypothetical protein